MQILISSPASSRYFALKCHASDLVSQVKTAIAIKEGVQASEQLLSFHCKPLSDSRSLDEYGITDRSTLTLNCRIRGGSGKIMSRDNSQVESIKSIKKLQQKRSKSIIEDFIRDKEKLLPTGFASVDALKELYNVQKKLKQQKYEGKPLLRDESEILSVAMTRDNKFVVYGLQNGSVKVFDFEEKREYCHFNHTHTHAVLSVAVTSDNRYVVSASRDYSIKIFDLQTKQEYHHFKDAHQGAINSIAVSSDSKLIISGSNDCSVKIFDILRKQQIYHFENVHTSYITSVVISYDNSLIVSGSSDNSIKVFDLQTKQELHHFKDAATGNITSIAISNDSKLVIAGSSSRSIHVFDIFLKQQIHHFQEAHEGEITSVVLFGENRFVASSSTDSSIKIFDLQTKQELFHRFILLDRINSICVSNDNRYLLSASDDQVITIFDLQVEQEHLSFKNAHSSEITSVVISSDNRFVVSGSLDKSIKIFDLQTKKEHYHFKDAHDGPISAMAVSCDDKFIVSGSHDRSIKVFDIQKIREEYHHFRNIHTDVVSSVAVSIHNKYIISGSHDKSIKVLDIRTRQELYHFKDAHADIICSVIVSSDDRFIVSGSRDESIKIFDLKKKQAHHRFNDVHKNGITTIALSNDNKYIISGGNDNSIKVFDFRAKQQLYQFKNAHKDTIQSVAISSDNKFIISGSWDKSIKVFDLPNRQEHCHFQNAHKDHITSIGLSKDNNLIVSASNDRSLKIFKILTINDAEIVYRSTNIPPNMSFTSFDDFLFTNSTNEYFKTLILFYADFQILPYYWTVLHILCIFQKSKLIARCVSYEHLKVPSLLDSYGKTPLHYLVAQDNIHYPSVNIILTYILDYLEDKPNRDPYEVEMIFKSLTCLFQFILSKANSAVRERYLKAIFMSPYSLEELPSYGLPVVQKTIAKSSIMDSAVIDKIYIEGNEPIMFRTVMLYCDFRTTHDEMYDLIRTLLYLKNEEIFKSPAISHIINHLWKETRFPLIISSIFFTFIMILWSVYIGLGERRLWIEIILLFFGVFSLFGEFIQMFILGNRYGEFLWCYIDIAQGALTIPFVILRMTNDEETLAVKWLASIAIILGYIRWATYLRLLKPVRSLIQVVISIVQDMSGFILFIVFIIICFSLILLQFDRNFDFPDHLYITYEALFAIYEGDELSASQKIIGGIALFLLNVVFLNLLISIMGDSYDKVQERRVLTESLTKLDMILEVTTYNKAFLKFTAKPEEKGFLTYCLPDRGDEEFEDSQATEWEGRINVIKKMLRHSEQKIVEIIEKKTDVTEKEMDIVQKKVDTIKKEITEEMDKKINMLEKKMEQEISQVKQLVENNHQEMLKTIKQLLTTDT